MSQVSLQQQIDFVRDRIVDHDDVMRHANPDREWQAKLVESKATLEAILATLVGYQAAQQAKVPR